MRLSLVIVAVVILGLTMMYTLEHSYRQHPRPAMATILNEVPSLRADYSAPLHLADLMPSQWLVSDIIIDAVPYGYGISSDQRSGVGITFSGPIVKQGARRDSFILYFMPLSYHPADVVRTIPWPEGASKGFLGQNRMTKIYFFCPTAKIASWPSWKEDVKRHFKLENEKK